jgi:hypothetical protein
MHCNKLRKLYSILRCKEFKIRKSFFLPAVILTLSLSSPIASAFEHFLSPIPGTMNIYPFSSDAETGISSDKTYTHAVNLGAASTGETIVNGVPFINASGDGEVNGYGWIGVEGNLHGGGNTSAIGTPSTEAVYALINPFIFEARSEYIILTNLTPDTVYDFRIYTRSWDLGKTRKVLFTLFPDYHLSPSWQVDMDNTFGDGLACDSVISFCYKADAEGSVKLKRVSQTYGATHHFYAFSNELVEDTMIIDLAVVEPFADGVSIEAFVNLSPDFIEADVLAAVGNTDFGLDFDLWDQVQILGKASDSGIALWDVTNLLPQANYTVRLCITNGNSAIWSEPLAFTTGADENAPMNFLAFKTNVAQVVSITGDADCGISTSKIYTHTIDFGAQPPAVINGVEFEGTTHWTGTSIQGYGWSGFPGATANGQINNIASPPGDGIHDLLSDLNYDNANGIFRLTGLTPNKPYELRLYQRAWSLNANRMNTFTFNLGLPDFFVISVDTDYTSVPADGYLSYTYLAPESGELAVKYVAANGANTYHMYGFTNEEAHNANIYPRYIGDVLATLDYPFTGNNGDVVYVCYDFTDKGQNMNAWSNKEEVGTFMEGDTLAKHTISNLQEKTSYIAYFCVSNGNSIAWSHPVSFTTFSSMPVLNTREARQGPDRGMQLSTEIVFPGTTGTCNLSLEYGPLADKSVTNTVTVGSFTNQGEIVSTKLIDLTDGTPYWYRFIAESGSLVTITPDGEFMAYERMSMDPIVYVNPANTITNENVSMIETQMCLDINEPGGVWVSSKPDSQFSFFWHSKNIYIDYGTHIGAVPITHTDSFNKPKRLKISTTFASDDHWNEGNSYAFGFWEDPLPPKGTMGAGMTGILMAWSYETQKTTLSIVYKAQILKSFDITELSEGPLLGGHSHSASFEIDRRKGNIFNVYFDGTMIEGAYVNGDLGADEDTIYAGFQTGHKSYVFDMLLEGANEHPSIIVIK